MRSKATAYRLERGAALITVLLLLSAMLVMAAAVQLAVLLDATLSRNRVEHAVGIAEARSHVVHAVHHLRTELAAGASVPESLSGVPGLVSWQLVDEDTFHLVLTSATRSPVTVEATLFTDAAGRVHVLQMR